MTQRLIDSLFVLLIAALAAAPVAALPARIGGVAEAFATCAGRMGAMATRARAFDRTQATDFDRMRGTFDELLGALAVPDGQARHWRNTGWTETAQLLADVDYSFDARRAARAENLLAGRLRTCRQMVLMGT